MNHSLRTADLETHVRIVAMSLIAGMIIILGALHARPDLANGSISVKRGGVITASWHSVYSAEVHTTVR
jgi:hypothetical protein